jgi:two-component system phosphate regulon sensor histidine kinase PhoR
VLHEIRWRIAFWYVLLISIALVSSNVLSAYFIRQTYVNDLEKELEAEARLLATQLQPLFLSESSPAQFDFLSKQYADLIEKRVTILGIDGTVLGESHNDLSRMDNHLNRPEIRLALATGAGSSMRFSSTVGADMVYSAVLVKANGDPVGFVRIALPLSDLQARVTRFFRIQIFVLITTQTIAILVALWLANRITRPLHQLTEQAQRLASRGTYDRIFPVSKDEVGQLTRAFNEMTSQLQTQINSLESERQKMAAVLSEMSDGVIIINREGKIQLINSAIENIFDIFLSDALDKTLAEAFRMHQLVDLWRHSLESQSTQVEIIDLTPRKLFFLGTATPLGEALPGSTLIILQDQTRLRQLETVRKDFISNISHELRTPLASLKALTETLQEGALEDPQVAHGFLQKMETEVDALTQMVSELIELARIESGRVPFQFTLVSPCALLSAARERLSLQAERAGMVVTINCDPNLPDVLADPPRMQQVIVNLLHNAIKFSASGGKIELQAQRPVEPYLEKKILFTVSDSGSGISTDDLPRIFERFYKADRARSGGGTGLGLSIARHIVEAHGGKIWADSVEGQGSTFFFTIPIA